MAKIVKPDVSIADFKERTSLYLQNGTNPASSTIIAKPSPQPHNEHMETITRPELDAKLEAVEARMDARISRIENIATDMKDQYKGIMSGISSMKTTAVVTGISAALAIVFGVAAFNATLLSNMTASYESGKSTATAMTQATEQMRQTQEQLKAIQARLDQQATALIPAHPIK